LIDVFGTFAVLAAWLFTVSHAQSADISGRVVSVQDGDTLTVLVDRRQIKVRLADIDAPESKQPFGTGSRQSLAAVCFNNEALLETQGTDRYGRTIATVHCAGSNANAMQVRQGMAWVFDRYASPNSPLYALQNEAKAARRGLWSDPQPIPPWEWRRKQGKHRAAKVLANNYGPSRLRPEFSTEADCRLSGAGDAKKFAELADQLTYALIEVSNA
jgi:endonuclease YncB( thermonuclease family)